MAKSTVVKFNNGLLKPRTLRWTEPFGGGISLQDTGLCNRLFHWEVAYDLNRKNKKEFTILLESVYWKELEFIRLPDTVSVITAPGDHPKLHSLKFRTVYDTDNDSVRLATPITTSQLQEAFTKKKFTLDKDDHYYSDFGYKFIGEMQKISPLKKRGLQQITFYDKVIPQIIKSITDGLVGIHIRRGVGVFKTKEDIETLPEYLWDQLKPSLWDPVYRFKYDTEFFAYIDAILKKNPTQRFYISSDLPTNFVQHYKERYGHDVIITRDNILGPVLHHLKGYKEIDEEGLVAISNLIDLFALTYCKFILKSAASTWSDFAVINKNVPHTTLGSNPVDAAKLTLDAVYKPPLI